MKKSRNQYLIIPINQELGSTDDFYLLKALEAVVTAKRFRNGKSYLKKELGCSGNSVKNMTRTKMYTRTLNWNLDEYKTKDAYRYIRKLDKEKYADMINLIVSEYAKIAKNQRDALFEDLNKYKVSTPSYQTAFCYKSIDGLKTVDFDPITANRINKIENTQNIAEGMLNALNEKKVKIQP